MSDHTHDFWPTPGGGLTCRCGHSLRHTTEPRERTMSTTETPALPPAEPLTPAEAAEVARFGLDIPEVDE